LVFEIKTGDVIDFSFDGLVLRWKYHGISKGCTLGAWSGAIGNTSEHTIILLSWKNTFLMTFLKFNIQYRKNNEIMSNKSSFSSKILLINKFKDL
jgi:hypothetical protein